MYYALDVQAGLEPYVEETFIPRMRRWLIASLVVELFFYTSLLLVKLAFMFFFRRLGDGIEYFKWVWWPVLVLTLGSYFGAVGNVHYKCLVGPVETILTECNTASSIKFVINTLKANCALDVLTDFLSTYSHSSPLSLTPFMMRVSNLRLYQSCSSLLFYSGEPRYDGLRNLQSLASSRYHLSPWLLPSRESQTLTQRRDRTEILTVHIFGYGVISNPMSVRVKI